MDTATDSFQTIVVRGDKAMDRSATVVAMNEHVHAQPSALASVLGFGWHFVQMVLVMMVGMGIYHLLYAVLDTPLGISAALRPYPAIKQLLMDISMVVPMVAFMWYRRASWRRNMEMAAAMMVGPVVFMACLQLGLHGYIPGLSGQALKAAAEISMYLGMLAVMLYRRNEHAHGHGAGRLAANGHTGAPQHEPAGHSMHVVHNAH